MIDLKDAVKEIAEEEPWDDDDIPDEFSDPIMMTLMRDPVLLPSSKVVCDRTVITRHLLSEQTDPYTKQKLTVEDLVPQADLKEKIDLWIKDQIEQSKK